MVASPSQILTADCHTPKLKIAAFDFDNTLYSKSPSWGMVSSHIPSKLLALSLRGFKIVVFSNRSTVGRCRDLFEMQAKLDDLRHDVDKFLYFVNFHMARLLRKDVISAQAPGDERLHLAMNDENTYSSLCVYKEAGKLNSLPLSFFFALSRGDAITKDPYLKPKDGMWKLYLRLVAQHEIAYEEKLGLKKKACFETSKTTLFEPEDAFLDKVAEEEEYLSIDLNELTGESCIDLDHSFFVGDSALKGAGTTDTDKVVRIFSDIIEESTLLILYL